MKKAKIYVANFNKKNKKKFKKHQHWFWNQKQFDLSYEKQPSEIVRVIQLRKDSVWIDAQLK